MLDMDNDNNASDRQEQEVYYVSDYFLVAPFDEFH